MKTFRLAFPLWLVPFLFAATLVHATPQRALIKVTSQGSVGAAGSGALSTSFTIEGGVAKSVLIRAAGPAISGMSDPILVLFDRFGLPVAANNDWGSAATSSAIAAATTAVGAAQFADGSKDAAILMTLNPGTYTARVDGASGSSGNAQIEVYDADTSSLTPRIAYQNLNTRITTGGATVSAGFSIASGAASQTVLVRALGPALIGAGVSSTLSDPSLTIKDSSNAVVASNNNWGNATSSPTLTSASATAGLRPLADGSNDAALLVTLAPGNYTAEITGGGGTGTVLLEIAIADADRVDFAPALLGPVLPTATGLGGGISLSANMIPGRPSPTTVQWRKNGVDIPGATNMGLFLSNVAAADAANYSVAISNSAGSVITVPTAATIWSQVNPATHTGAFYSAAYSGTTYVAVGDSGLIFTSPNAQAWTRVTTTANQLKSVAFGGGRFVAVGSGGTVRVSTDDGATWTAQAFPVAQNLNGVLYDGTRFVAVGASSTVIYSTDGVTWIAGNLGTASKTLNAVAFKTGGNYVTVATDGTIYSTADVTTGTWTAGTSNTSNQLNGVAFVNGLFVAVGNSGTIRSSATGSGSWTSVTNSNSSNLNAVAFGASTYVAVGGNTLLTSTDAATWTSANILPIGSASANGLLFANSQFVSVGFPGTVVTSSTGAANSWTLRTGALTVNYNDAAYGNGRFVAVAQNGSILTSADGSAITSLAPVVPTLSSITLRRVAYGAGVFVTVGDSGTILTSVDGAVWNNRSFGTTNYTALVFGAGKFVAAGASGVYATSVDGQNWIAGSGTIGTANVNGLAYGAATPLFVAANASGGIFTSADAVTWTAQASNTSNALNNVRFVGGQFIALGASSTILTSADGIAWVQRGLPFGGVNLIDVAHGGGLNIAIHNSNNIGLNGNVFLSVDGVSWTVTNLGSSLGTPVNFFAQGGITYGNGTFFTATNSGIVARSLANTAIARIITQPVTQTIGAGQSATLSVATNGVSGTNYQWYRGISGDTSNLLAGQTGTSLVTGISGHYWVQVTGAGPAVNSAMADVVGPAPTINTQPVAATVILGGGGSLSVAATSNSGGPPLTYQWRKFGVPVAGATSASLGLSGVGFADAGYYDVVVSDGLASVVSKAVRVDVVPAVANYPGVVRPRANAPRIEINNSNATAIAVDSADLNRIYVAGEFTRINGDTRLGIARFNADGSYDSTWVPPIIVGGAGIRAILVESDGIIIGGDFTSLGGVTRNRIAKLSKTTGALDTTFAPTGAGATASVYALARQVMADSTVRYLVGGSFSSFGGINNVNRLVRVDATGQIDTTFAVGSTGFGSDVRVLAVDGTGAAAKIYAGGTFTSHNGVTTNRNRLVRLDNNGAFDSAFDVGSGFNSDVRTIVLQGTGASIKVYVGGLFTTVGGLSTTPASPSGTITLSRLVRLTSTGAIDNTFAIGTAFNSDVLSLALDSTGNVYVAGNFNNFNGTTTNVNRLIRLTALGARDAGFNNGLGGANGTVNTILLLEDTVTPANSRLLFGGQFSTWNSTNARDGFARVALDATGTIDALPAATIRRPGQVLAIEPAPNGKWYVGGQFNFVDDVARQNLARLNADGTFDSGLPLVGSGFNGTVNGLAVQGDGRIVAVGNFTSYAGTTRNEILRLNPDATLDTSFNPGGGFSSSASAIQLLPDGRMVVIGSFTGYNSVTRNRIARLQSDGSLDTTFDPLAGFTTNFNVPAPIALQSDGKIVVGGTFTTYNGATVGGIVRILDTGAIDLTYNSNGAGGSNAGFASSVQVQAMATRLNDKLAVVGNFTTYNGTTRTRVGWLDSTGALDSVFTTTTGANSTVTALHVQSDDKTIAAGFFSTAAGATQNTFARFNANGTIDAALFVPTALIPFSQVNVVRPTADGGLIVGATRLDFTDLIGRSLVVLEAAPVPVITVPPSNQATTQNGSVTFNVTATGENPQYQWFKDGALLTGATASSLTVTNVQVANLGNYTVRVSNAYGSVTSSPAIITATNAAPVINTQPGNVATISGTTATLTVAASGTGLQYQWRRGGIPIAGATTASLVINPAKRFDADTYDVVINSGIAVTVSSPARLTVAPVAQPQGLRLDAAFTTVIDSSSQNLLNRVVVDTYASERKFVTAGDFRLVNGQLRNRVVRFNGDGSLDTTFVPVLTSPAPISALAVQTDHKVLVGGPLAATSLTDAKRLVRLNSDGSPDTAFNNNVPIVGGNVLTIVVQGDGKILAAGQFSFFFNGRTRNRIVRLNSDGTIDDSFLGDVGNGINAMALQADGKILVGGSFTTPRTRVARLNSDGTLDSSFDPGTGPDGTVLAIAQARDGSNKIIIGGQFNNVAGNSSARLARLTSTGGFDNTLVLGTGFNNNINDLLCMTDGRTIVSGAFTSLGGTSTNGSLSYNRLLRLNINGSVDTSFATGSGLNGTGSTLAFYQSTTAEDSVLVAGSFTTVNGSVHAPIVRYNTSSGAADSAVNPTFIVAAGPTALSALPDGGFLVAGSFTAAEGATRINLARYSASGILDSAFRAGPGVINNNVTAMTVRGDGKVMIAGVFTSIDGTAAGRIARLNADGTLDSSFNSTVGSNSTPNFIVLQPDGRVLTGGPTSFTYNGGASRTGIIRLMPDGSPDPGWVNLNTAGGFNGQVLAAAVQSDGKVLIGGQFGTLNGTTIPAIIRLNADGSLDTGFTPGTFNSSVSAITVVPGTPGSEAILIGGSFTNIGGTTRNRVARLNSNGTLDTGFDPGSGANSTVSGIALQEDGKILLRGSFSSFGPGGTPNTVNVVRLLANGTLDSTFGVYGLTTSSGSTGMLVLDDGTLLLSAFGMYDGTVTRYSVAHTVAAAARTITVQPQPATVNEGQDATFSVTATGTGPITYQWLKDGNAITGATSSTLVIAHPSRDDAGNYSVQVTNLAGTITSAAATLSVNSAPYISSISPSQTVDPQGNVTLFAEIKSEPAPIAVQWLKNGVPIPGASFPTYNIGNVQPADAGTYSLLVTNSVGSSISTAQSAIVGGWFFTNAGPAHSTGIISFLANGEYFLAEDGDSTADPTGTRGMEHGQYTWNASTGAYTMTPKTDTNGGWGFAHMTGAATLTVSGNTLTSGSTSLTRVTSASNPAIGSFAGGDNLGSFCLTFLADGSYFMAEDGAPETTGFPGMERGTYTYDAATGAFTATAPAATDTNGDWGINGAVGSVAIFGNVMEFTGEDTTRLDRVVPMATVLTVTGKPAISAGPVSAAVAVGGSTTLSVTATGTGTLSYQWRRNGAIITGATSSSLPVTLNAPGDAAVFDVVVTNANGSTTSRAANVGLDATVLDESFVPPQFANPSFSGMLEVLSDGSFLVGAHIRQGAGTQMRDRGAGMARYFADGTPDPMFKWKYPADFGSLNSEALPVAGKFYAAVDTSRYTGTTPKATIARFFNDGTLDTTFAPFTYDSLVADDNVTGLLLQADGKLIVSGEFTNVNGTGRGGLFRLNTDGSLDTSFTVTSYAGGRGLFAAPVFDANGKIMVAGEFTSFNGTTVSGGVVRLNADGSLDSSFAPTGYTFGGAIRGLMVQSTGKIVLGGRFTVNGTSQIPFIRLNSTGALDSSFVTFTIPTSGFINSDLIPLGGDKFAGTPLTVVVCNADGSRVPASEFTSPDWYNIITPVSTSSTPSAISRIRRRPDGSYLIGGGFTHLNGVAAPGVALLSSTGAVIPSAIDGTGFTTLPLTFVRTANGHTLAGTTDYFKGLTNASGTFIDLQADGSVATVPFSPSLTDTNFYFSFTQVGDGRTFVIAEDPNEQRFFRRLLANGSVDPSLTVTAAPPGGPKPDFAYVQSDFKTLIMARFADDQDVVNGENLRRLNVDGSLDAGYNADLDQVATAVRGTPLAGETVGPLQTVTRLGIEVLAVDSSNRSYVRYPANGGVTRLARLNANGSRDTSFSIITTPTAAGSFTSETITDPLRPNAAPATVTVSAPSRREFLDVVPQASGKIIIAGNFKTLTIDGSTTNQPGIARLNANGTLDTSFNLGGTGPGWTVTPVTATDFPAVEAMVQQADGRILLAGNFEAYNGMPAPGLVRINPNGTYDPTFVSPVARSPRYSTWPEMKLQDDGSILLMGGYVVPGERFARGIVRLTITGAAPTITQQPAPATVVAGGEVTLSVAPGGTGPFTYQWRLNGTDLPNANGPTLLLSNIQPGQYGDYTVVVSNPFSSIVSGAATIAAAPGTSAYLSAAGFARPEFRHATMAGRATLGSGGKVYATFTNGGYLTGANQQRLGSVIRLNANGTVDSSFLNGDFLNMAWAVVEQPDGKVLVGGAASFETESTGPLNKRIWRFLANGLVDTTYKSPVLDSGARYITLQPDGKLLVGQESTSVSNGGLTARLIRLNTDGSQDVTFIPPAFSGTVSPAGIFATILVDAQGRILIGGTFNNVNGQPRLAVARLNSDGTLDASFVPAGYAISAGNPQIRGLGFQTQGANAGKILVAGTTIISGTQRPVIRLNSDGSFDSSFVLQTMSNVVGAGGVRPRLLAVLPDDRFYTVSANVTRFNSDGSIDGTYTRPVFSGGALNGEMFWMDVYSDGRVVVTPDVGNLVNGSAATSLVRFTATGAVDATFTPPSFQTEIYPEQGAVVAGNKFITWGSFDTVGATPRGGLARFNVDGTLDSSFVPAAVANLYGVSSAAVTSDGGVLASTLLGLTPSSGLAGGLTRFTSTGAVDGTFVPDSSITAAANGGGFGLFMQADNKALIWSQNTQRVIDGGFFFRRINIDGSLDNTFTGPGANFGAVFRDGSQNITSITVGGFEVLGAYPDGRLIALATKAPYSANQTSFDWTLYRLTAAGAIDGTFTAPTITTSTISSFDAVTDAVKNITTPTQFPTTTFDHFPVRGAIATADGVLIYGDFTSIAGQPSSGIARLTSTGAVDSTFNVGIGIELRSQPGRSARVGSVTIDSAGKYWISGSFDTVGGRAAPGIARLNADGSVDPTFATSISYQPWVGFRTNVVLKSNYDALVLGTFGQSTDLFPFGLNAISAPTPPSAPPPAPVTTAVGGSASFTVVPTGTGPFTYLWQKVGGSLSGNALGATTATLTINPATAGDAGSYTVTITGPGGASTTTPVALTVQVPVTITVPPQSQAVSTGQPFSLHVTATGTGPFTYDWIKDNISTGVTTATYDKASAQSGDAGSYTVKVSNLVSSPTSTPAAVVTVLPAGFSASQTLIGPGYIPGGTVTITNTIHYSGSLSALGWHVLLPAGWTFESDSLPVVPSSHPNPGDTSVIEYSWVTVPADGATFTYTLGVPEGTTGPQTITAMMLPRQNSIQYSLMAKPDPLVIDKVIYHSADTGNGVTPGAPPDNRIELTELLRVIELYNTRNGTVRTGAYAVDPSNTEDGFTTDPARTPSQVVTLTRYHSADTGDGLNPGAPRDGKLELTELLRVIELYNYRSGTVRTGEYHAAVGTEDGYAPGPAPLN